MRHLSFSRESFNLSKRRFSLRKLRFSFLSFLKLKYVFSELLYVSF